MSPVWINVSQPLHHPEFPVWESNQAGRLGPSASTLLSRPERVVSPAAGLRKGVRGFGHPHTHTPLLSVGLGLIKASYRIA